MDMGTFCIHNLVGHATQCIGWSGNRSLVCSLVQTAADLEP